MAEHRGDGSDAVNVQDLATMLDAGVTQSATRCSDATWLIGHARSIGLIG